MSRSSSKVTIGFPESYWLTLCACMGPGHPYLFYFSVSQVLGIVSATGRGSKNHPINIWNYLEAFESQSNYWPYKNKKDCECTVGIAAEDSGNTTQRTPYDSELYVSTWLGSNAQLFGHDVAVMAFVDVINIYKQRTLRKEDYPLCHGRASSNQSKRKDWGFLKKQFGLKTAA